MSTISSISKDTAVYTVLDHCVPRKNEDALTVAILPCSGEPFFSPLVKEVLRINPQELIIFNTNLNNIPDLNQVRYIHINDDMTPGEMVNIAIREAHSKFVFVIWSNQEFSAQDVSAQVFWRIEERKDLCTVGQLYDCLGTALPVHSIPAFDRIGFRVVRNVSESQDTRIFSPFDYSGVYNRTRFLNLGGYDPIIKNPYWQKNDFSMRAALWGERIALNPSLNLRYTIDPDSENEDFDFSSRIFALKCLGIRLGKNGAYLPLFRWIWIAHSPHSCTIFKEILTWVHENRFRFLTEVEQIVDHWSTG